MASMRVQLLSVVVGLLATVGSPSAAFSHGRIPESAPVDRIVKNLEASLKDKPNDAELHYRLGRTHGLALELKAGTLGVWDRNSQSEIAEKCWQWAADGDAKKPTDAQLLVHLREAVTHLNKAIELDSRPARYHLALGSVLESGLPLVDQIDAFPRCSSAAANGTDLGELKKLVDDPLKLDEVRRLLNPRWPGERGTAMRDQIVTLLVQKLSDPDPKRVAAVRQVLVEDWKKQIGEEYFTAMCFALPQDSGQSEKPIWGSMDCWIAFDAAGSYVRVLDGGLVAVPLPVRTATAKAVVKSFEGLPKPGAITPIIFPVDGDRPLRSLLAEAAPVRFDLDGSGRNQSWNWVRPEAGILVWDPERTGKITSGRQLFGSVSWWIFFDNGYQALDALDDNRDGELTRNELAGIAVWVDRNGNGVADPGEVTPVEQFGIRTLSVRATTTEDGCPANRDGIVMADGRVRPTYDWIATTAEPKRRVTPRVAKAGPAVWLFAALPIALPLMTRPRRRHQE